MKFNKEGDLYLPDNRLCSINPGIMPIIGVQGVASPPLTGMAVWYKTPIPGLIEGDDINATDHLWPDSSGNGIVGQGAGGSNPKARYRLNILDGFPGVECFSDPNGIVSFLGLTAFAAAWTEAEVIFVLKNTNDPGAGGGSGFAVMGYHTSWHTFTDGHMYHDAFSSNAAAKDAGNSAVDLTNPHVLDIVSATNLWTLYINNNQEFTTGTNTFVNNLLPFFAEMSFGFNNINLIYQGHYIEVLMYDHILDAGERTTLYDYLADRFPSIGL